ncbi:MAG: precorrin-2 C(20)-methyltransferase [Wujia sp.]
MINKGRLYGIGVGPGDPELMTVKAINTIKKCNVISIPAADKDSCTAYRIAVEAVPEMLNKEILSVAVPMTMDLTRLNKAYDEGSEKLAAMLDSGKDVAFLNLGDPTIYGTYMSIHERILGMGYEAEIVSGVPSFCAVAAVLSTYIGLRNNVIHILPGQKVDSDELIEMLENGDTVVIMKSGNSISELKNSLIKLEQEGRLRALAVMDCGMPTERVFNSICNLPDDSGYFTTILVHPKNSPEDMRNKQTY